jgi:hypothetical protein
MDSKFGKKPGNPNIAGARAPAARVESGRRTLLGSKKGSSAVFLTIILSALLLLAGVLIQAAGLAAGKSYGDLVFQMAGRSLLSEYDRKLYEDYGLFAMRSDEELAARKLLHYSDASLKDGGRAGTVWLLPCNVGEITVRLSDFSLLDADTFEDQILKDIKFITVNNLMDRLRAAPTGSGTPDSADGGTPRTINNESVLNSLPSRGLGGDGPSVVSMLAAGLPSVTDILSGGTDAFLVSEYIMARFAHAYAPVPTPASGHTRFFQNETEYIIIGGRSDADNLKSVESRLRALRFALNEVFVHSNSELRAQANAVVAVLVAIFPEIPASFFRELVYAAWVAAETENDLKLLRAGEKVALVKNKGNWAVNASSVLGLVFAYFSARADGGSADIKDTAGNATGSWGMLRPTDGDGFSYGDYLRLFLFFTSRENKLLRSMDLIQINMKTGYYEAFLIREHYVGLRYELVMNGDTYKYRQSYDAQRG